MGSPKALLPFEGTTFLDRLIQTCNQSGEEVVVVLGYHEAEIRAGVRCTARFVRNPDPARGQLSSMQCGLAVIPGAAMFIPVDLPAVNPLTVHALLLEFSKGQYPVVAPRFDGRHGHPVCIARCVVEELLALPTTAQARDVIRKYRPQTLFVDVEDAAVLHDIDTPVEYRNLTESVR